MGRGEWASLAVVAALGAAAPATAAGCSIAKFVDLPVTMAGDRPMVSGRFGEREVRFILDSGAFWSTVSQATATEFGMPVRPAPPSFRLQGLGGFTSASIAEPRNLVLSGVPIPRADFIVGGSDTGTGGLIGQNILGLADVEYDLPHGTVHLIRAQGCGNAMLAYWHGDRPVSDLPLERGQPGAFKPHTVGTILLNGVKVRALFDTGADTSLLSLAAARRLGVTKDSPGVQAAGVSHGLGTHAVPTWRATFDKIDIGGEIISHPEIRIAEMTLPDADMLIGVDFFLTHRIFVSNSAHRMFFTYEGGPLFGRSFKGAVDAAGKQLDLTDKAGDPTDAAGFARRGAVLASNQRRTEAMADLDKAIALDPKNGSYLVQRAMVRLADNQPLPARDDLDRALALDPHNTEARLVRAGLRLRAKDRAGALEDASALEADLPPSSDARLKLGQLLGVLDQPARAIAAYDLWLRSHPEDNGRPSALNGRCWARALLGQELDKALADCNAALHLRPGVAAYLDSRALVRLRLGELDAAITDYDAALAANPREAWSLYARSIADARAGKAEQATADRQAALAINPDVVERGRRYGLEK